MHGSEPTCPPDELAGHTIVDAHVHAFPPRVQAAIWRWFDSHAWRIRYRMEARESLSFLLDRGVSRLVLLHYAHAPGMAAALNLFAADLAREDGRLVACATVLPGEDGARRILDVALGELGCRGIKIHCHVQRLAPDDPRLDDVYRAAADHRVPVVIHAGDAPAFGGYGCDVEALCTPERLDRALSRHPAARVIVPHLGAGRMEEVAALLDRHEGLHLDTTMVLAGFLPMDGFTRAADPMRAPDFLARARAIVRRWPDRILYGTDFPNIPYPWDQELRAIASLSLPPDAAAAVLGGNAIRLFGL